MKRLLQPLLFLLGLSLLGWMIWTTGPRQLWHSLVSMPLTIIGCILVWAVGYLLNALSWAIVMGRDAVSRIGLMRLVRLTVTGYALNYVTPFGLLGGEPYRIVALRPLIGSQAATSGVLIYLTMHVLSHLVLWLTTSLLAVWLVPRFEAHLVQALLILVGVLAALVALYCLLRLIPALRCHLDGYGRDARQLLRHQSRRFLGALLVEYVSRLWNCLQYLLILRVLGFDMGFFDALFIVAFSSLVANLLFFSPLQMGTREGGIYLALQMLLPVAAVTHDPTLMATSLTDPTLMATSQSASPLLSLAVTISLVTRVTEFAWIAIGLLPLARRKPLS